MVSRCRGRLGLLERARAASRAEAGMTILEILITMVVLLIAVLGTLGSISSFAVLGDSSRETNLAYLEAQRMIERMQSGVFREVFVRFNDTTADDPAGGVSPGSDFDVPGLNVQEGDPAGKPVRTPPAQPGSLFEFTNDADLGLPRDLNADGVVDLANHADDYTILPVRVRVEWQGQSGNRFIELQTYMRSQ